MRSAETLASGDPCAEVKQTTSHLPKPGRMTSPSADSATAFCVMDGKRFSKTATS